MDSGRWLGGIIMHEKARSNYFNSRGVFDASPDTAKRLIELGSKDALCPC